jgi:hypothetical protein
MGIVRNMSATDDFAWLMQWYVSQCDEDWEHQYGVTIDTLDNPGWSLKVDLDGTPLEGLAFLPLYEGVSAEEQPGQGLDGDVPWLICRVEGSKFKGWGGPRDLARLISTFRHWAEDTIPR